MRVIAGTARSLRLKTVEGLDIRPTTDRIKETLFNMLSSYIYDADFLDLFAGSGAIGIEALSRGAGSCTFIELNPKAVSCIKENLEFSKLDKKAKVLKYDAISYVSGLSEVDCDVIFMDPPYDRQLEMRVLEALGNKKFVRDTLIVVEALLDDDFSYLANFGFEIVKEKKYKTNKHIFIEKRN